MTISSEDFRDVLRHFPAGVTLVTAGRGEKAHGLTVSAFASVSAEPAMIAVILDLRNQIHPYLETPKASFAVSLLAEEQRGLSNRFASHPSEGRFATGRWTTAPSGVPVLDDALAWLDCEVENHLEAGSHRIYVGRVHASRVNRPGELPLVYWNRDYRGLRAAQSALTEGQAR